MQRQVAAKHFGEEWVDFMSGFTSTETFSNILATLKKEKGEGTVIFPEPANVFRAFRETPLSKVRVVILGQDPYPREGYANGLAFAHAPQLKIAASLEKIIDAIEVDCYDGLNFDKPKFDTTLSHWTKQGVLLLNTALTVKQDVIGSHTELWKPFTEYVCATLSKVSKAMIWLAWGNEAQSFIKEINPFENFIFNFQHPSAAARAKEPWKCNHFSLTNAVITKNNLGDKITW